jgi:hypothetical protein
MGEPRSPADEDRAEPEVAGLCRAGGVAAFVLLAYSLATLVQMVVLGGPPATAAEAFEVLREDRLLGLLRLDLPTALALPFYYLLFLGVFAALRRAEPAATLLSIVLAFAGVTLVLAAPGSLSMLALGDRHAAATSEAARRELLVAGEALLAADMWHSTGAYMGAILLQSGALLVSVAMLRTRVFGRPTAWVGILTHGLDLIHVVLGPFAPGPGVALMAVAGPLYLAWFPMVGRRLLALGRGRPSA